MVSNQTAQTDSNRPATNDRPVLSWQGLAVIGAVSGVCFVAGFYLGVYALLGVAGFGDLHGWLFLIVTVPLGGLLAGLGAATAGPSTRTMLGPAVAASLLTAIVVTGILIAADAGFGAAIAAGGILSLLAATLTVARGAERRGRTAL